MDAREACPADPERAGRVLRSWRARLAALGAAGIGVGMLVAIFDFPVRASQPVEVAILLIGSLCVAAFLVLDEVERRDAR